MQPKIVDLASLEDYRLKLTYETGEIKIFDVKPYIFGGWFGKLHDVGYFKSVRILPDGKGIKWHDGQDIAPHELYEESVPFVA